MSPSRKEKTPACSSAFVLRPTANLRWLLTWRKISFTFQGDPCAMQMYALGVFGSSIFAKVAGAGTLIEFLKPPKVAEFPTVLGIVHFFATDGSVRKMPQGKFQGSFSVVDSFSNFFVHQIEFSKLPSSTYLELLALKKLFSALSKSEVQNCTVVLIIDSLSAIKLTLGLDVREENLEILRKIDISRKVLKEKNVKEFFLHVRSHRKVPVELNCKADDYAGVFAFCASAKKTAKRKISRVIVFRI